MSPALASTFDDYHNRLKQAVAAVDSLSQVDETESFEQLNQRFEATITLVRSLLPPMETVEWDNEKVVVQNQWVHDSLKDYKSKQGSEAAAVLRSLAERLQALEQRLDEMKAARDANGVSGSAASTKLKEILERPEFATKKDAGSAFQRLWQKLMRWLRDLLPKPRSLSPGSADVATLIAQIFVFAVASVVIIYVFWKLLPRFIRSRRGRKKTKTEPRIVLGEKLAPDESASDILAEAEALARHGDLRAAIRKAYIALLVELGERKLVSLAQYKTNRDYLRAVRRVEPLYSTMKTLTDSFERHWYGFVGATDNDWIAFRAAYERALAR